MTTRTRLKLVGAPGEDQKSTHSHDPVDGIEVATIFSADQIEQSSDAPPPIEQ